MPKSRLRVWFGLPYIALGTTKDFSFSLCRSPTPAAPEALQLLEWELSRAATATYSQLLQPGGALSARGVSEKGVLQLLMDVRFIRDVLVGGRPVGTRPAGQAVGGAGAGASGGLHPSGSGGALPGAVSVGGLLPGVGVGGELADPTVASALAERKREAAALEQMLQVGPPA